MPNKTDVSKLQGIDFIGLARKEKNPRIRVRLLALAQLQKKHNISVVAEMFNTRWKTVKNWLRKFLENGEEGLGDKARSGRKPKLAEGQIEGFRCAIEDAQTKRDGGRLIGKDIQKILLKQFAAEYDLDSIYKLLKRIGMVWITGRSVHPKADKEVQEAFKKTLPKK